MGFEKAFRGTLIKWQQIAAGKLQNPASDCGLCEWAIERRGEDNTSKCRFCPAWHYYGECKCGDSVLALGEAVYVYGEMMHGDDVLGLDLPLCAQEVVKELLAIKENLFEWAAKLEAQREE